ncbi:flagellar hook protein FlgE [Pseudoduganella flava]|uniref:Flagellar hook protein FlgE n=1 Tax=Pseudoduganella flava TaxID=871742 RepID=A0A562Q029_9BURK|nr:flagellar hook protein FlgE [Pseudoduganella flava]QGZ38447.1 flagellar hook-basal body complex protein [Pseudoduganella flava]TWI50004.1 flagellar hook protein FlgE [Pseudoduganella flava]
MSFNIALSGIQAINEQLSSISNNIANAGTYGYKAQRANFSSMYAGSQPTGTQIGSTTQNIGLTGGVLNTGRSLDASIDGKGFFISKTSTGETVYSRVGIFTKDANDYLVDSAGRRVQGYPVAQPSGTKGTLGDLTVPTGLLKASPSTAIDFTANLSADWPVMPAAGWVPPNAAATPPVVADPSTYSMSKVTLAYDSLGNSHTVTQYFFADDAAARTVQVRTSVDGVQLPPTDGGEATLTFDTTGQLVVTAPATKVTNTLKFTGKDAEASEITIDFTGTTFQKGEATTSTNAADGYAAGSYVGVELGADGSVIAKYSNGQKQQVGIVALATFKNEDGLTPVNDTSWTASAASGAANEGEPGRGNAGSLAVSSLEGSNVDITSELVNLMGSQRNYQANSKVITTENQMLQSLMQAL